MLIRSRSAGFSTTANRPERAAATFPAFNRAVNPPEPSPASR
jgi:hypothetical protein